jgi:uncharacterized sulfatase
LSGLRPGKTGIYDLETPVRTHMPDVVFLPQHFRNNGYFTARVDKVFHIGRDDALSWDISEEPGRRDGRPPNRPVYTPQEIDALRLEPHIIGQGKLSGGSGEMGTWMIVDLPDEKLMDGMTAAWICGLLEKGVSVGKPFFVAAGFRRPHLPWIAPKKYFDMYPPDQIEAPDRFHTDGPEKLMDEHIWREGLAAYYACTSFMDAQVGKLLDKLDELKLWDDTVVVLFGDNGYCLGEKNNHFGKGNLYERSLQVPLIIAAPGAEGNGTGSEHVVELLDIYPTLAAQCGLGEPASGLDGRDLSPLLEKSSERWADYAVGVARSRRPEGFRASIRNERYRYNEAADGEAQALYDLQKDPLEQENLINSEKAAAIQKEMRQMLHRVRG